MSLLFEKLKEILLSIGPVSLIVSFLHFTLTPLPQETYWSFLLGALCLVLGLAIFLTGIEESMDAIGHGIGSVVTKSGKLSLVIAVGLSLGFFISFAEPDLRILALQVEELTAGLFSQMRMVLVVSLGLGLLMTLALVRILYSMPMKYVFLASYGLIFLLSFFSDSRFLAIAFDASGATTGAITVPFMLALAGGVSSMKEDSKAGEADTFGLVGIASSGAILGVLLTEVFTGVDLSQASYQLEEAIQYPSLGAKYWALLVHLSKESFLSLLPILVFYLFFQLKSIRAPKRELAKVLLGLAVTFLGLVVFLLGVNGGFMEAGLLLGQGLAGLASPLPMLLVALALGLLTALAEPAVYVLTHQVEAITGGYVRRSLVLAFMALAVGLAILLSVLRAMLPGFQLWMLIFPGFGLSIFLAFFVPELFVGLAFDAGGVASGPLTATFSLAFVQGIAQRLPQADLLTEGFGMIAVVAMMPILALQILGILYRRKTRTLPAQIGEKE